MQLSQPRPFPTPLSFPLSATVSENSSEPKVAQKSEETGDRIEKGVPGERVKKRPNAEAKSRDGAVTDRAAC